MGSSLIPRDDLKTFFDGLEGNPVVGEVERTAVTLEEVRRMVEACPHEQVFVEGQHLPPHPPAVVVHFGPGAWLWVWEQYPLFDDLRKFWYGSRPR